MTSKFIRSRGPWELAFERLRRDRAAILPAAAILAIVLLEIFAPPITSVVGHSPIAPYRQSGLSASGIPVAPNRTFWFGAEGLGRGVLVRVVYGARISLLVAVTAS